MSDLPAGVQIGPTWWSFEVSDQRCHDMGDVYGFTHYKTAELVVAEEGTVSIGQQRDTALHEVFHALFDCTLAAKHGEHALFSSDEAEEHFILRLTPHLLDFIRRNPDFIAYLQTDDDAIEETSG